MLQPSAPRTAAAPIGLRASGRRTILKSMADEPENLTLKMLREMRAEIQERDEKRAMEIAKVHADVSRGNSAVAQLQADLAKMHADVMEAKALALEIVLKFRSLDKRVEKLEGTPA
jgi:hypothetical protein